MKQEFVVVNEEGNLSWSVEKDATERFRSFKAAKARAEELAGLAPGEPIRIYELTAESIAAVGKIETHRKHPIEHYK